MSEQVIATPYTRIVVDPLVICTIVEAAPRVGGKLTKCVCALVGVVKDDGSIDITDAFANHYSETSEGIEKVHHDLMWQTRQKISPGEILTGWATTDLDLQTLQSISDWARVDQKASKFVPKKRLPSPLLMIVKLPTAESDLEIKAYTKGPIANCLLKPAPITIAQTGNGMDLAMFSEPANFFISSNSINDAIKVDKNPNIHRLELLLLRIERTIKFVDDVIHKRAEADPDIGRMIFNAVTPSILDPADATLVINSQDSILSFYMTNLVKLQFLIAEKLHLLFA